MPQEPAAGAPAPPSSDRKRRRTWLWALLVVVLLVVVAVAGVWLGRGPIGAKLAIAWLRARGVPAEVRIEQLGPSGFTASVILGPRSDPDLAVEHMEVEFEPGLQWLSGLAAPRIRSIRLVQPRLKVEFDGRRLSLGSLQRLLAALKPAGAPTAPLPSVEIEEGRVRLVTPAGSVTAVGDGTIQGGRLTSLGARLLPARLARGGFEADVQGGRMDVWGAARLRAAVGVRLASLRWRGDELRQAVVGIGARASAPASTRLEVEGPATLAIEARAASARHAGVALEAPVVKALFQGAFAGPPSAMQADGTGRLQATAESAGDAALAARGPGLDLVLHDLHLRLGRARELRVSFEGRAVADRLADGALHAQSAGWRGGGAVEIAGGSLSARLRGALAARADEAPAAAARFARTLPLVGADPGARAAAARLISVGAFSAPDLDLVLDRSSLRVSAGRPASLSAPGAAIRLSPRAGEPLLAMDGSEARGAFDLAVAGPDLPQLGAAVSRYQGRWTNGQASGIADLGLHAALNDSTMAGARLEAAGRVSLAGRRLAFALNGCAAGSVAGLRAGREAVLQEGSLQVCPAGGRPIWSMDGSGWRVVGEVRALRAKAPRLGMTLEDAAAEVSLAAPRRGPLSGAAEIREAVIAGSSADPLFLPVRASGRLQVGSGVATGLFQVAENAGRRPIGAVTLRQDLASGAGQARISAPDLSFDPRGLQPGKLFPMAASLATQARGRAAFDGWARWGRTGLTSGGELKLGGLDFRSPLGPVQGLQSDVRFDSLLPLTTPAGQRATAQRVQTVTELSDAEAVFSIRPDSLHVAGARADAAGGKLGLGPLTIPFSGDHRTSGVVTFQGIDLGALLRSSSFADRISAQARLAGEVRFTASTSGFHILSGRAFAAGPGRLSISRAALTGVAASGAAPGAPNGSSQPNAMQDLAYQALEELAFEKLDAVIEPRPGGRLGMVFHIQGRHDPPKAAQATISLFDLLRGKAFQKHIPLPKGTPINLTLDTSINFDELVHDYMAATSAGSAEVQP